MRAKDVMTTDPIVVGPETTVGEIAELLLQRRISGVPVADAAGRVLGVVSEDDLMHRPEIGGPRRRSRWLTWFSGGQTGDFVKTHGRIARDVMSAPAIVVDEEASIADIARLLEERRIKRVPVLRDGKLVGIVSRADLLRGFAAAQRAPAAVAADDGALRTAILAAMKREGWPMAAIVNVVVSDGVAHLWGLLDPEEDPRALVLLVEGVPGVKAVEDHRGHVPVAYAYAV
jgi:CBS domain-containing protein